MIGRETRVLLRHYLQAGGEQGRDQAPLGRAVGFGPSVRQMSAGIIDVPVRLLLREGSGLKTLTVQWPLTICS